MSQYLGVESEIEGNVCKIIQFLTWQRLIHKQRAKLLEEEKRTRRVQVMRKMVKNYDTDNERSQMAVWNGGIEAAKAEN